jgi:hypothetical protein
MEGQPVTVDVCEKYHQEICERLAKHDERAEAIEKSQDMILESQAVIIKSQENAAMRDEKIERHLEAASANLEVATQAIADNAKWQAWAQQSLSSDQSARRKEMWRLLGIVCIVILALFGLKVAGIPL